MTPEPTYNGAALAWFLLTLAFIFGGWGLVHRLRRLWHDAQHAAYARHGKPCPGCTPPTPRGNVFV